mgnify:CR=1 FL=1
MKIYYAHHVWKYDTPMENFEIKCIERQFKDAVIVNPRTTIPQDQPESVILDYAYKALNNCDAIVFSTFSGMIGHGVFNEIIYAFNAGKKVYQVLQQPSFHQNLQHNYYIHQNMGQMQ